MPTEPRLHTLSFLFSSFSTAMSNPHQNSQQLPLFDISQPLIPSSLSQACKSWGFFHITNHGIPNTLYKRLYTLSTQFFKHPLETKLKLGPSSSINTYTPRFIASPFFESLRVSGPNFYASSKISSEMVFETPDQEFCDILQEYGNKMSELSKIIVAALLSCLGDGFGTKYYESEFGSCDGYLRINSYSAPETVEIEDVEGLGMHTDMSCITILYPDEIGALQVRSMGGEWIDIIPREGSLLVNIGDLLQAWTNRRLQSSHHRVVLRSLADRLSLAFFWCFEDEKVVLAPEDVVGEGEQRIYKPFICSDYVKYRENSEEGRYDKVGHTIDGFNIAQQRIQM